MTAQLLRESVAPIEPPQPTETPILRSRGRGARFVRGRPGDPAWERPALLALLASTSLLYLWGLGASGWANSYYSAAVQAGATSWKAFFFGSSDASNFITVDKAPAFLWPMEISARIFGVNAWSILVPQALEGVAAVGLLYAAVRRWFSPAAGLIAGAVMLVPASSRPYIGGSQNNSLWNLIFGYNGFGRLNGEENGSVGGGPQGAAGRWGPTGWLRLFNAEFGGQASWLLPAAAVLCVG